MSLNGLGNSGNHMIEQRTRTRYEACPDCHGTGEVECGTCEGTGNEAYVCPACGGNGTRINYRVAPWERPCDVCHGEGMLPAVCRTCGGTGNEPCRECDGGEVEVEL